MKPRITTLYTDVVTLRQADEVSQQLKMSRSAFIRQAIRNEVAHYLGRAIGALPPRAQDPAGIRPPNS